MNQRNEKEPHSSRLLLLLILLSIGICLLYVWVTQSIRPLYDLSRDESIPYSINATKTADYSPDFFTPVGNVNLSILFDLFQDLYPASTPENRMATLIVSLQTPVPFVTIPAGATQTDPTAAATLPLETKVAETALTENPVVIPNTHIPATSTPIPPPPPPPPPPKPTKEEPPPTIPPPTSAPLYLNFIDPSNDGKIITDNTETTFEVEAWDPAIGINNGDGITSITFNLYNSVGNVIHTYIDTTSSYCVFTGNNNCGDAASAGVLLSSDTYTLEATVLTDTSETKTITRTFVIPALTYLDIILPPSDGTVITNTADTKLEAEAWDTTIGITNGDGITSITFTLYDSIGNTIHTYTDIISLYCTFAGDVVCNNSASAGVTLNSDTYTLEATVLTDAGGTLTITRTFIIP